VSRLDLGQAGVALSVSGSWLDEAAKAEQLGYATIWLPGGQLDSLGRLADLVAVTRAARVVPAIIPLDRYSPDLVAGMYGQLEATAPGRFVAGLARDRAAGAILLLVTPAYVGMARQILGEDRTLVVDAMVVLDDDPVAARATARRPVRGLPGNRASFTRMGFAGTDISAATDTLVDQVVIWGDADRAAARTREYTDAGADHIMLHVLHDDGQPGPVEAARALASRLLS